MVGVSTSSVLVLSTPHADRAVAAYTDLLGPGWSDGADRHWQIGATRLVVRDGERDARLLIPATDLVPVADEDVLEPAVTLLGRRSIEVTPTDPIGGARGAAAGSAPIGIVDAGALAPGPAADEATEINRIDHVVMSSPTRDEALALFGAGLAMDFRLEQRFTLPRGGDEMHQLFLRGAGTVVEVLVSPQADRIELWGLAWTSADPDATHARLTGLGGDLSEIRAGHKPGTRVFTVRGEDLIVPTIVIGHE